MNQNGKEDRTVMGVADEVVREVVLGEFLYEDLRDVIPLNYETIFEAAIAKRIGGPMKDTDVFRELSIGGFMLHTAVVKEMMATGKFLDIPDLLLTLEKVDSADALRIKAYGNCVSCSIEDYTVDFHSKRVYAMKTSGVTNFPCMTCGRYCAWVCHPEKLVVRVKQYPGDEIVEFYRVMFGFPLNTEIEQNTWMFAPDILTFVKEWAEEDGTMHGCRVMWSPNQWTDRIKRVQIVHRNIRHLNDEDAETGFRITLEEMSDEKAAEVMADVKKLVTDSGPVPRDSPGRLVASELMNWLSAQGLYIKAEAPDPQLLAAAQKYFDTEIRPRNQPQPLAVRDRPLPPVHICGHDCSEPLCGNYPHKCTPECFYYQEKQSVCDTAPIWPAVLGDCTDSDFSGSFENSDESSSSEDKGGVWINDEFFPEASLSDMEREFERAELCDQEMALEDMACHGYPEMFTCPRCLQINEQIFALSEAQECIHMTPEEKEEWVKVELDMAGTDGFRAIVKKEETPEERHERLLREANTKQGPMWGGSEGAEKFSAHLDEIVEEKARRLQGQTIVQLEVGQDTKDRVTRQVTMYDELDVNDEFHPDDPVVVPEPLDDGVAEGPRPWRARLGRIWKKSDRVAASETAKGHMKWHDWKDWARTKYNSNARKITEDKQEGWGAFLWGSILGWSSWTGSWITLMSFTLLTLLWGPVIGITLGPLAGAVWWLGTPSLMRIGVMLLGMMGLEGLLYLWIGWTFFLICVTTGVTYATTSVAKRHYTKEERKQENQGFGIQDCFDMATMGSTIVPDYRKLSYIRNLVGLCKDLPVLVKGIATFYRGWTFDVKDCHLRPAPKFTVYSTEEVLYDVVGLSDNLTCSQVTMVGHLLCYCDDAGVWQPLDVPMVAEVPLNKMPRSIMNVDALLYQKNPLLPRLKEAHVQGVTFNPFKREIIKPSGERHDYKHSIETLKTKQAMELMDAELSVRQAFKTYNDIKVRNPKGRVDRTLKNEAQSALQEAQARLAHIQDLHEKQLKTFKQARKARLNVSTEVTAGVGYDASKEKERDAVPVAFVPEEKSNGMLDKLATIFDDGKQINQSFEMAIAFQAGSEFAAWVKKKFVAVRPVWWLVAAGSAVAALGVGVVYYFAKKKRDQSIRAASLPQVVQGNILKYDVDPSDMIVKFEQDGNFFAYNPERMNELAKGAKPGQIVPVNVVFARGGAKRVNMMVTDDGQLQSFRKDGWETSAPTRVPPDYPREKRKQLDRGTRRRVRNLEKLAKSVSSEKLQSLADVAKNTTDYKLTRKLHKVNLGVYNFEYETCVVPPKEEKQAADMSGEKEVDVTRFFKGDEIPQSGIDRFFSGNDLPQTKQAFRTANASRFLYAVTVNNENFGFVVKTPDALWFPFHYLDSDSKISTLVEGQQVLLVNTQSHERAQQIIWEPSRIKRINDMSDGCVLKLARPYSHLRAATTFEVLPDGTHVLWLNGLDPRTLEPWQNRVTAYKRGKDITYVTPNAKGICGATLSKDQDQLVIVGMHVRGNERTEAATAAAITPGFMAVHQNRPGDF